MVATGEADEAARLAGIATGRMKRIGLLLAGLFAGIMAMLLAAGLSSAAPNMAGDYLLYAIAAVLLGMTMFEPGKPNVPGTVFAALVLKVLGNGLGADGRTLLRAGYRSRRHHHRLGRLLGQRDEEGGLQGLADIVTGKRQGQVGETGGEFMTLSGNGCSAAALLALGQGAQAFEVGIIGFQFSSETHARVANAAAAAAKAKGWT
jgi:hypothetical protein